MNGVCKVKENSISLYNENLFNIHLPNVLTFIEYPSACTQEAPVDYFQIIDGELSRNCVFI